jgi:hypothetical protein
MGFCCCVVKVEVEAVGVSWVGDGTRILVSALTARMASHKDSRFSHLTASTFVALAG